MSRTIAIDHDSPVPAYQQIADELRGLIARGELASGEALPSVRQLGRQVGVNLNTVAKAFRVLAEEGLVELRQGAAARVRTAEPEQRDASLDNETRQALHRLIDRWVLGGADKKDVERLLTSAVKDYFQAARAAKGRPR